MFETESNHYDHTVTRSGAYVSARLFFQCTNKSAFISELKMKEVNYTENKSSHLSSTGTRDLFITVCHLKEVKKGETLSQEQPETSLEEKQIASLCQLAADCPI